jgi:hypothetical protein
MIRATALTSQDVDGYIQDRLAEGYARASVDRILQILKQAYKLAKLPAPDIRKLDESDNVRRGFFSESEIRKVIANLSPALADFTLFAWLCGMRKSEIASLRWTGGRVTWMGRLTGFLFLWHVSERLYTYRLVALQKRRALCLMTSRIVIQLSSPRAVLVSNGRLASIERNDAPSEDILRSPNGRPTHSATCRSLGCPVGCGRRG